MVALSIAMLNYQRVYPTLSHHLPSRNHYIPPLVLHSTIIHSPFLKNYIVISSHHSISLLSSLSSHYYRIITVSHYYIIFSLLSHYNPHDYPIIISWWSHHPIIIPFSSHHPIIPLISHDYPMVIPYLSHDFLHDPGLFQQLCIPLQLVAGVLQCQTVLIHRLTAQRLGLWKSWETLGK